ncbi:ribosome small subunit-dependent GTPase A [Hydrogenothermus marinus]|uniref:Small ribosomal subunit biogenesis GTPase RsgA n=1 Tax=Hydrogenothermus marinus TaxID=133270 RepID=A0A3M0BLS4_9AQUI|nr:ribosome small subunit-dependent GTPase A [Hydrogenothermus marinus]RMA97229.1 ribosome biogenesis GTPase [Hydrogenothermus marinus]
MKKGLVVDREAKYIGVYIDGKVYTGIPRKKVLKKTKIYAGDYVLGKIIDNENFAIEQIENRKNLLIRPKVANVDKALILQTLKMPPFDDFLLDNLLVIYDYFQVEPVIVFNKIDLLNEEENKELTDIENLYKNAGYQVYKVSTKTGEGIDKLKKSLEGDIIITAGPSGTGKSSLVSKILNIDLETGDVSKKTERGRHTTTGIKLFKFGENSFIADTPGFSSVDASLFMDKKEIKNHFREFLRYSCKFSDCTHTKEPGCKVKEAVEKGEISPKRYENYLKILEKAK